MTYELAIFFRAPGKRHFQLALLPPWRCHKRLRPGPAPARGIGAAYPPMPGANSNPPPPPPPPPGILTGGGTVLSGLGRANGQDKALFSAGSWWTKTPTLGRALGPARRGGDLSGASQRENRAHPAG